MVSLRLLICVVFSFLSVEGGFAQCSSSRDLNAAIDSNDVENQSDLPKLISVLRNLKKEFEGCGIGKDSVYAKILHKIAIQEFYNNDSRTGPDTYKYTEEAIRINTSAGRATYPAYAIKSYSNLALFSATDHARLRAIRYYDSVIVYGKRYREFPFFVLSASRYKAYALFDLGDYQGAIDAATLGLNDALNSGDSLKVIEFLSKRAEAWQFQDNFVSAGEDAAAAIQYGERQIAMITDDDDLRNNYAEQLATAYKIRATIITDPHAIKMFEANIAKALSYRKLTRNLQQLSADYIDIGAHYSNKFKNYKKAKDAYQQAIRYAGSDKYSLAFGALNLGAADFPGGDYAGAQQHYLEMLRLIDIPATSILQDQSVQQLMLVPYKNLVQTFLDNKTELLISLYKKTNDKKYLEASLRTAMTTDSVIRQIRLEQTAEESKLFWRRKTRTFFTNTLEACYLAGNYAQAFHFMEKSRAVILGDKLNELGAASLLPAEVVGQERAIQQQISSLESKLQSLTPADKTYNETTIAILEARLQLNRHIKQIEIRYPAYYRYKYSDSILLLKDFQKYLAGNKQSFVDYFVGDTVSYVLYVSPARVQMIRVPATGYHSKQLDTLSGYFSDKGFQNSRYKNFIVASNRFFHHMFEPLNPDAGSVIICADGFTLPFDALPSDLSGTKLLLEKYAFSYVYSAGSLLSKHDHRKASADFIGFAPVSFRPYLQLADLGPSAASLDEAAANYRHASVYLNERSSRNNFLSNLGSYNVINIFSHAAAGISNDEPVLYMQDSMIHLSELQYLPGLSARLVILSACQTSSGKNQAGEGIYSLSRGFAAAGIPTVMATIWNADEHAVYTISIRFHHYLARGIKQDEALRLAKLDYLANSGKEGSLPYYWSNIILMGNTDAIELEKNTSPVFLMVGIAAMVAGIGVAFIMARRRKLSTAQSKNRRRNF